MKAVNLHLLTRIRQPQTMSMLYAALSGRHGRKGISPHEAASLCALTDLLTDGLKASFPGGTDWMTLLDGFFFSYVIEHIGKEFDLLKISSDGECVLNIELKSEDIGDDRIKKQLEQNRYYLSHAAHTIFSFTYVMDTGVLYCLNDRGYLRRASVEELLRVLQRPSLRNYLSEGIDRFFRALDYLISPVAAPEKFLQGQYFLTNQQFDFKRRIMDHLREESLPVISIVGIAGTGKTLLLFDLAMDLSRKARVLIVHAGLLRMGHEVIHGRLKNVDIISALSLPRGGMLSGYRCLMIDEADHLEKPVLKRLLREAAAQAVPSVLTYDPRHLLDEAGLDEECSASADYISRNSTLSLTFTGNIRINRPVYSFLRSLLNLKEQAGKPDYSCIDILYANDQDELSLISRYYQDQGYDLISAQSGHVKEDAVIAQEYNKVLMILDSGYYYDESLHLCVRQDQEQSLRLLYEGLSRTRENLCLIVADNPELFSQILEIRLSSS